MFRVTEKVSGRYFEADFGIENAQKTPRKRPENAQKAPGNIGKAIIDVIRENPGVTRRELERLLSRTPDSIKYHLARLTEQGFIKREGPDKGGRWIVLGE